MEFIEISSFDFCHEKENVSIQQKIIWMCYMACPNQASHCVMDNTRINDYLYMNLARVSCGQVSGPLLMIQITLILTLQNYASLVEDHFKLLLIWNILVEQADVPI